MAKVGDKEYIVTRTELETKLKSCLKNGSTITDSLNNTITLEDGYYGFILSDYNDSLPEKLRTGEGKLITGILNQYTIKSEDNGDTLVQVIMQLPSQATEESNPTSAVMYARSYYNSAFTDWIIGGGKGVDPTNNGIVFEVVNGELQVVYDLDGEAVYYVVDGELVDELKNLIQSNSSVAAISLTETLTAGQTELVFENEYIEEDGNFKFYANKYNVNAKSILVEAGKLTMTFDPLEEDLEVQVIINGEALTHDYMLLKTEITTSLNETEPGKAADATVIKTLNDKIDNRFKLDYSKIVDLTTVLGTVNGTYTVPSDGILMLYTNTPYNANCEGYYFIMSKYLNDIIICHRGYSSSTVIQSDTSQVIVNEGDVLTVNELVSRQINYVKFIPFK